MVYFGEFDKAVMIRLLLFCSVMIGCLLSANTSAQFLNKNVAQRVTQHYFVSNNSYRPNNISHHLSTTSKQFNNALPLLLNEGEDEVLPLFLVLLVAVTRQYLQKSEHYLLSILFRDINNALVIRAPPQ